MDIVERLNISLPKEWTLNIKYNKEKWHGFLTYTNKLGGEERFCRKLAELDDVVENKIRFSSETMKRATKSDLGRALLELKAEANKLNKEGIKPDDPGILNQSSRALTKKKPPVSKTTKNAVAKPKPSAVKNKSVPKVGQKPATTVTGITKVRASGKPKKTLAQVPATTGSSTSDRSNQAFSKQPPPPPPPALSSQPSPPALKTAVAELLPFRVATRPIAVTARGRKRSHRSSNGADPTPVSDDVETDKAPPKKSRKGVGGRTDGHAAAASALALHQVCRSSVDVDGSFLFRIRS